jgi:hypothetical protein
MRITLWPKRNLAIINGSHSMSTAGRDRANGRRWSGSANGTIETAESVTKITDITAFREVLIDAQWSEAIVLRGVKVSLSQAGRHSMPKPTKPAARPSTIDSLPLLYNLCLPFAKNVI